MTPRAVITTATVTTAEARPRGLSARIVAALLLLTALALAYTASRHPPQTDDQAVLPARGIAATLATHPTWPQAWAAEAQRLAAAGDYSSRFDTALQQAVERGPSERAMRQALALLALRHWPELSPQAQRISEDNLRFALQTQPRRVLVSAFRQRQEARVCALWTQGGAVAEVCEQQRQLRALCDRPRPSVTLAEWCLTRGAVPLHAPRR